MTLGRLGKGQGHCLEHYAAYADILRQRLRNADLESRVTVYQHDLRPCPAAPDGALWYGGGEIPGLPSGFELVLVDGPPVATTMPHGRLAALYAVWDHLAPRSIVLLDDGKRSSERETVARWQEDFADEITATLLDTQKGLWLIQVEKK
jgi:hypothetical protein